VLKRVAPIGVVVKDGKLGGVKFINNELGRSTIQVASNRCRFRDRNTWWMSGHAHRGHQASSPEGVGPQGFEDHALDRDRQPPNHSHHQSSRRVRRGRRDLGTEHGDSRRSPRARARRSMLRRTLSAASLLKQLPKVKLPSFYVEPVQGTGEEEESDGMAARVQQPHPAGRESSREFRRGRAVHLGRGGPV